MKHPDPKKHQQISFIKSGIRIAGYIDLEDVPENLRYTNTEDYDSQETFDFYKDESTEKIECDIHTRYDWVLNEMIDVKEEVDGSAVIELPESIPSPDVKVVGNSRSANYTYI